MSKSFIINLLWLIADGGTGDSVRKMRLLKLISEISRPTIIKFRRQTKSSLSKAAAQNCTYFRSEPTLGGKT